MKNKKILLGAVAVLAAIILLITGICINLNRKTTSVSISTPELARAMTYGEFEEGDEAVESTDNVKFSAFFLRDLDGDGYAEKIKGTCRPIGEQDTLYMEINVQTEGYLKDGKIEIAGQNFYLQTALPKDEQLKDNYIGNNIRTIEFNTLNNGTQKLLSGIVRSGDYSYASIQNSAIGNNINNYSREDNKIKLTGTYVGEDGTETEISKEILLTVDWYGTTYATISNTYQSKYDLTERIDEENGTIKLNFTVNTKETESILNLSKNHVEGTIPTLDGYSPIEVRMTNATSENLRFTYDAVTRKFTIDRTGTTREDGIIEATVSRNNEYNLEVTYSIEAYKLLGEDTVSIQIPVQTYYEGYNNPNEEFDNPYKSNTVEATIRVNYSKPVETTPGEVIRQPQFGITVGKSIYNPYYRNIVSKEKPLRIYNEISEKETEDTYIVRWYAYTGTEGETTGLVMKERKTGDAQVVDKFIKTDMAEESMENVTSNVGIYITGADNILKEDGWIKVYDEETDNLLVTFTKDNWNTYSSYNPYKYELPVKHIRIETSETNKEEALYVYNIKELDDEYITENYTKEEFDNLQYIKSTLNGYLGGNYVRTVTNRANYEAPYGVATIGISNNTISTQETEENEKITITASYNENYNQAGWIDGSFLVKLPEEILAVEINSVEISNENVTITSYELVEKEQGKFIKINTQNNNDTAQGYTITIDTNMTPDPRIATVTGTIELYAANEEVVEYYYKGQDIYDVNNNLNTEEIINKVTTTISLVSPNSLLTNQTVSEYDSKNSVVISPQVAEIKPIYAEIDNETKTAKIGVQVTNTYSNTVSDVVILGRIPFAGNRYAISGGELGSTFTTKMLNTGIEVPEELEGKVKIYYSENENTNKNLSDEQNVWKTAEEITNWDNIKTYLIDFEDTVINTGTQYTFYYVIERPTGELNEVAYSHHGVYFSLDTEEGKYRSQTEPNKVGLKIVEKFDLEVIKTQIEKEKRVAGATYSVKEILEDGTVGVTKTGVTNENGTLTIENLYAEKTYEIQEIKSPNDYELNEEVIRFTSHVSEDGTLTIEKLQGTTKEDIVVTKNEGEKHKATVQVEDEAKAKLKIIKKEQGTEKVIQGVRYKLTGAGLSTKGRIITTNVNGEVTTRGLKVGEEYILEEIKAEGYYLSEEQIKFKIVNNEGTYELEIIEGTVLANSVTEENSLPTANLILENEKKPTYTLEISKIKKVLETELTDTDTETEENSTEEQEVTYLEGAKFRLYKDGKIIGTYTTDANGKIIIENLYQYVEGKNEEATYTLKEVMAPVGYAKVKDITFKVQNTDGILTFINTEGKEEKYTIEGRTVKLTIEDSPSFRLIKKDGEIGEALANVKFAIYNAEDPKNETIPATNSKGEIIGTLETIKGEQYYTLTTDNNGIITADLPEGLYKAVEVEAPEKYDIEKSIYYFGIGESRKSKKDTQVEWGQAIRRMYHVDVKSVAETSDGGYIAVGSFGINKYSAAGKEEWGKGSGTAYAIELTHDGGYIVGGTFGIEKYSAEGEKEWSKSIETVSSIELTHDGGYIVGGTFGIEKYSAEGEAEWVKSTGSSVYSVSQTSDGGYIVGGSSGIEKYSSTGEEEWSKSIGTVRTISKTSDGGYIVGGDFRGRSIDLGNGVVLTNNGVVDQYVSTTDGMLIKYSESGEAEWAKSIGGNNNEYIYSVSETSDGGYIVGGDFYSSTIDLGNGVILTKNQNKDAMLIKYSAEGKVEWGKEIAGDGHDHISSVLETKDSGYIVAGNFGGWTIDLGNGVTLTNNNPSIHEGKDAGMVIKYKTIETEPETPETQELIVENYRKEFKITTNVNEIDGIKGGAISGEGETPYEIVKYGDNNTKEIVMKPDENYEIMKITINGEEHIFTVNDDDTYTMPVITNITEDKHIEVTFALKDNRITINKIDSETKEGLEGAIFKLDQIEEREVPESTIGSLTNNGQEYIEPDLEKEATEVLGELTNNGKYYFVEQNGKYVSNNSYWSNTTSNSYIPIDLTNKQGIYALIVNANVSSEYADYGYATITESTTAPSYSSITGRFICISGTDTSVTTPKDYQAELLEGGKIYYLHLGYRKNAYESFGSDKFTVNSVKLYETKTVTYGFVENDGKYESIIQGRDNRIANSYIPIDLTDYTGTYNLIVNANVSSQSYSDYGYATVTENTTRPAYNSSTGRFIYISGTSESVTTPRDYTTLIEGGKIYYLHLGYYKNALGSEGEDKFTVNSITVTPSELSLYHIQVTTNSEGKGATQIPFGKYAITEIVAPVGYELNENSVIVEFRADQNHEFTIENNKLAKVVVHHYIKGTETKVAEDDILQDKAGYPYTAVPKLDLEKYELEKAEDGNYIIPENATGQYVSGEQEVIYYYVEKDIPLVVNHYIEGTTDSVPLSDGNVAESITTYGNAGEEYKTTAIPDNELSREYELLEIPSNSTGTYEGNIVEVTYYYKKVVRNLVINKYCEDGVTPLEGAEFTILGKNEGIKKEIVETEEIHNNGNYYFEKQGNNFVSNNQYGDSTTANSYIKIDLTKTSVNVELTVNAQISSESGFDIGYATITESIAAPSYDSSIGRFIYVSGIISAQDYTTELEGGKNYYLHLGYRKDGSDRGGTDTFTINSIKINGVDYSEYIGGKVIAERITEYTTDKQGKIETSLPVGDYIITETKAPEGYELPENPTQEITISKDVEEVTLDIINEPERGIVIVYHYLEGTEESLVNPEIKKGDIGLIYATKPNDELVINYHVVNSPENRSGFYEEETIEVKYYYSLKKDVEYKVEWYYQEEGKYTEVPNKSETRIADALEEVKVTEEDMTVAEEYDSYVHDTEIEVLEGTVLGDGSLILKIYFKPQFKVTYKPGEQGLFEEETHENIDYGSKLPKFEGEIGEGGNPKGKEGYVFRGWRTEEGEEAEEIVTKDVVYVAQWKKAEVEYIVEYYYDGVKDEIKTDILKGEYEEVIENYKDKAKENHTLIKTKGLPLTITNKAEENIIRIYYGTKAEASVQYITKTTNEETGEEVEEILEESTEEGYVGKEYITIAKDFDNYILVEQPEEKTVVMTEEEKVLKYYYEKVESGVIEKHIESHREEIIDSKVHEGKIGEEYKTEEQEFIGFRLLRNRYPENAEGTIAEEVITVKYYYSKDAKVTVKYIDIATNEEIEESVIIEGQLGEEYETEEKAIDGYRIVKLEYPDNAKGEITKEEIEVIYYYERIPSGTITVKYVDLETEEEIADRVEIKGFIGEEYKTETKEIPYYMIVNSTENTAGKLTEENDTVIYYYRKLSFNFRIDKTITQINLRDREIKFDKPTKIAKIEIKQGELNEEELVITYNLEITNTGEMSGKARIKEIIPQGFELLEGIEESTIIELQPGESKNMTVKLRWLKGEQNLGIKENSVELVDITNAKGYRELTTEDNNSSATVVITIKTGETIKNIAKGLLILSLAICLYMEILLVISIKKGPDIKEIKFLKKK